MFLMQMTGVFSIGAILGSFLNVCIYRLPRKESIVWPRSQCRSCTRTLVWWENVPVLSYIVLAGKCRTCRAAISATYPFIEILTGSLLVLAWVQHGMSPGFVQHALLILFLLPISFIDLDTKLILNVLTIPGMCVGLLSSLFVPDLSPIQSGLGLLAGGGFLFAIGLMGEWLFKQESMGGGDIKLGAMIGAFMGPVVVVALFLAFFLALPVIAIGFGAKKLHLGSKIPFGPFLSLAALVLTFFGQALYSQYMKLLAYL